MSAFEVGKPAPYYCKACQAVPQEGYCRMAGCPTAPAAAGSPSASRRDGDGLADLIREVRGYAVAGGELDLSERDALLALTARAERLLGALKAAEGELSWAFIGSSSVERLANASLAAKAAIDKAEGY